MSLYRSVVDFAKALVRIFQRPAGASSAVGRHRVLVADLVEHGR